MRPVKYVVYELEKLGFKEHVGRKSYLKMVYLRNFNDAKLYFLKDERGDYIFEYYPDIGFYCRPTIIGNPIKPEVQDLPSLLILYGRGHYLNEKD